MRALSQLKPSSKRILRRSARAKPIVRARDCSWMGNRPTNTERKTMLSIPSTNSRAVREPSATAASNMKSCVHPVLTGNGSG